MVSKKPAVAVIIPAYNESFTISEVITNLSLALKRSKIIHKIIVVDDSSQDNTGQLAEKSGAHVIRHMFNTGSGGATATGLRYAKSNNFGMAATFDADGQHHPDDLVRGIRHMLQNGGDLLIGSRLIDPVGMPKLKVLGNRCLSSITYYLFGVRVTDSQSGLRIFSRKALHQLKWKTYGYEFCSEMIWRAKQSKMAINEFPVRSIYTDYSKMKGQKNWNSVLIIKSLLKRRILGLFNE